MQNYNDGVIATYNLPENILPRILVALCVEQTMGRIRNHRLTGKGLEINFGRYSNAFLRLMSFEYGLVNKYGMPVNVLSFQIDYAIQ